MITAAPTFAMRFFFRCKARRGGREESEREGNEKDETMKEEARER